jgi:hypothetical protein
VENRACLSRGVQVAVVGDLVQRIGDSQAQVRYSVVERSEGRVTPYAICTVHEKARSTDFLAEPLNQGQRLVSGLALKPLGWFSLFWSQNRW